jgi:transglutaminase-like putative cysteine protease
MAILKVEHKTAYHYARAVKFNEHRLLCRPRDSHDLRLLDTTLTISPAPASTRWIHDVFGNSIALVTFAQEATELVFVSSFRAEHYPSEPREIEIEDYARRLPFNYSADDVSDLGRTHERHYSDPEHKIDLWAKSFVDGDALTLDTLRHLTHAIKERFEYARRDEEGTQNPLDTLTSHSGSCRDFALLMMEAARSLGMAARFVSGYLYDEKPVGAQPGGAGGGATHAWAQIFLPGAGWVEFDPTNALIGGRNLIRVAVARDASQAIPLSGSFVGGTGAYLGMEIDVKVTIA